MTLSTPWHWPNVLQFRIFAPCAYLSRREAGDSVADGVQGLLAGGGGKTGDVMAVATDAILKQLYERPRRKKIKYNKRAQGWPA